MAPTSLLLHAKGDAIFAQPVAVNCVTLGLKSNRSLALVPSGRCGISLLNLSLGYEFTVNTSPVSSEGTL